MSATDQQKIGLFLKTLRREKGLTQEQLAEKFSVSGRTVSRWETGVNLPDLSLLVELADYYDVDIREIIDGERKSEIMNTETKETLLKVSDYAAEEKKRQVGKTKRRTVLTAVLLCTFIILTALGLNFFFGNPISKALAVNNAQTILRMRFYDEPFTVESADYWIEDMEYNVYITNAESPDSAFSMNFGMFGNYRYDTYDKVIRTKSNTFDRMNREYNALAEQALGEGLQKEDTILYFGDILDADAAEEYTIKGISADDLRLDQSFDFLSLGKQAGQIVIQIRDSDFSAEHLAALMLQVKQTLDTHGVSFAVISLSLIDTDAGTDGSGYPSVGVFGFPYGDITEEGLVSRVAAAMGE